MKCQIQWLCYLLQSGCFPALWAKPVPPIGAVAGISLDFRTEPNTIEMCPSTCPPRVCISQLLTDWTWLICRSLEKLPFGISFTENTFQLYSSLAYLITDRNRDRSTGDMRSKRTQQLCRWVCYSYELKGNPQTEMIPQSKIEITCLVILSHSQLTFALYFSTLTLFLWGVIYIVLTECIKWSSMNVYLVTTIWKSLCWEIHSFNP